MFNFFHNIGAGIAVGISSIFLFFPFFAYAISGACSAHNGVNCSVGSNYAGYAVCNDGWTSTTKYSDTDECKNSTPSCKEWFDLESKYNVIGLYNQMQDVIGKMSANTLGAFDLNLASSLQTQYNLLKIQYDEAYNQAAVQCYALGSIDDAKQQQEQRNLDYYNAQIKANNDAVTQLEAEQQKVEDAKIQALKDNLARTQAIANSVEAAMLNPDTALMYSQAGITLNDSPATISAKLAQYQYREEIRIHTNSMTVQGYQVVLPSALAGKQEADIVRWKDSKGNEIIYWKPPVASPKNLSYESFKDWLKTHPSTPVAPVIKKQASSTIYDGLIQKLNSQATTSPMQKSRTFWQKVASPFLYLWGRIFK